jgi:hypothetical protein
VFLSLESGSDSNTPYQGKQSSAGDLVKAVISLERQFLVMFSITRWAFDAATSNRKRDRI